MLAEDLHAKHGCFTFTLHAHAHSFEINSSMHGDDTLVLGAKGCSNWCLLARKLAIASLLKTGHG